MIAGKIVSKITYNVLSGMLTLSVLSDVYVRQCTIQADVHIRTGITGSSEIVIQGRIVSATENYKNR